MAVMLFTAWFWVERYASQGYRSFAEKNRGLQVELAATAMETGFKQLLRESSILASYSFVEFEERLRTGAQMDDLLASEQASYEESTIYAYYQKPGKLRFINADSGSEAFLAAIDAAVPGVWGYFIATPTAAIVVQPGKGGGPAPFFMIFYPVRASGSMRGVVCLSVSLGQAVRRYLQPMIAPGRSLALESNDGTVLWSSDPSAFPSPAKKGSLTTTRSFTLGMTEFSIIEEDSESVLNRDFIPADRLRSGLFAFCFFIGLLSVYIIVRLYAAEKGRNVLVTEEKRLEETVEERGRELKASELRFGTVFESAFDTIFIIDSNSLIIRVNQRAEQVFGRPVSELINLSPGAFSPEFQPDGRPSVETAAQYVSRSAAGESVIFEWTHLRADGTPFLAEVSLAPAYTDQGNYIVGILRDITDRVRTEQDLRRALEDREILLRELNHRVKNNLQFLDSLIELQKGYEGEASRKALSSTQSRVAALATSYLLAADSADSFNIDAPSYLGAICSQIRGEAESMEVRFPVELDCAPIPISLDSAVPLGLLLRELLINSAVHGYGPGSGGKAMVGFKFDGQEAELSVRDFGRGWDEPRPEGLGLMIVRALCGQLGGSLSFEAGDPGLVVRVRFPLA
jgi:PAS domain S-box-containing protein